VKKNAACQQREFKKAFYRMGEAANYLGIGRTKLHFLSESDPDFPQKIRLSRRCVGFRRESLDAWLKLKEQQEAAL